MKYCIYCGVQLKDDQKFCDQCGKNLDDYEVSNDKKNNAKLNKSGTTLQLTAFIFMIIGCVLVGATIIPLIWCIPLTIMSYKNYKLGTPLSTGCKVCCLLFVSLIGGICMLVED